MRGRIVAALAGAVFGASVATAITLAVDDQPEPNEVVIVRDTPTTRTECVQTGGGKHDLPRTICTSQ